MSVERLDVDTLDYNGLVTPPMTQEEMVARMQEMASSVNSHEVDTAAAEFNAPIPEEQLEVSKDQFNTMMDSLRKHVSEGVEPESEDLAANIAERYVKTAQAKPDKNYEPVDEGEYQFAKLVVGTAKPEGQPDEEGFYAYYKNDAGVRIHGGDMEIFRNMIRRHNAGKPYSGAPAAESAAVPGRAESTIDPKILGMTKRKLDDLEANRSGRPGKQSKKAGQSVDSTGDKPAEPTDRDTAENDRNSPKAPDRRKNRSSSKKAAASAEPTTQSSESEGGNKPDGQKAKDKASDEKAPKTNAEPTDEQAEEVPVPTGESVKISAQRKKAENRARRTAERAAADESRTLDEDKGLPQMPEAASEDPVLNAEDADGGDGTYQMDGTAGANAVVNIGFRTLKPGGNRDEPKDWVYEDGFVLQPKPVRTPEAGPEKAATDEASEPGERQVPLSRYERLKNIAKSAGKAVVESGVFNRDVDERANRRISKERSADEAEFPVNISQRIRERTSDLLNRAKYGALPTALALSEKAANLYGSQREQFTSADGSSRTDKLTDLFRKRGENGELGEISPGKVVAAAAGVLALYTASRFLGELPSGMGGGAKLNHAPDALNNMKAGGAGNDIYNPYAGGSVGRGGISTEAAAPQGGGRLVNHPNAGDVLPEAAPGAPKFNDEQLSNYATLHAGQRVDTASEALQDMFRKNGVAANREQFNTLLQDALKYDADVHQFTEGKTYDPTSMPDGYRFYLMNMDDIMRRLDELK